MPPQWDPEIPIPPAPFNEAHCRLALKLKEAGLSWKPQVGCFVWDRDGSIEASSPFGNNIYFILDMKPFLRRFGGIERISSALVWLPTWHQACWICERLGVDPDVVGGVNRGKAEAMAGEDLLDLYEVILSVLQGTLGFNRAGAGEEAERETWLCGPLDDLEACSPDWEGELKESLRKLFASRRLAVLSTQRDGKPYASLVAFAATADLRQLLFATTRSTRKFSYMASDPNVAMLIDNRTNEVSDFRNAMAVTALGTVEEIAITGDKELRAIYLAKHPYLKGFVASPTCAFLRITVQTYYVVQRFQHVLELHVGE